MASDKGKVDQKVNSSEKSKAKKASDYVFAPIEGLNFRYESFSIDIVPSSKKGEDGNYVRDPSQPPIAFLKLGFKKDKDGKPATIVGPAFAISKIAIELAKAIDENKNGLRDELDKTADWLNAFKKETVGFSS